MSPLKVGVIGGAGYIGLVTGACLASLGCVVRCMDADRDRIEGLRNGRLPFYEPGLAELVAETRTDGRLLFTTRLEDAMTGADMALLCVGTPMGADGAADLSQMEHAVRELLPHLGGCRLVAIKSTVPPGTGRRIGRLVEGRWHGGCAVASVPEFLQEGSAVQGFLHPDRIVLGVADPGAEPLLRALHRGIEAPTIVTTPENAEMIKYASNAMLAARVSLVNELAEICERVGADVVEVMRGVGCDARIGPRYLRAGLGFGGPCLEKDVQALVGLATTGGYTPALLAAVRTVNLQRTEAVLAKVRSLLGEPAGWRIAVLGLAFKADTSDIRDSRSLALIRALLAARAQVVAHDPRASRDEAQRAIPGLECAPTIEAALSGADLAILATEWREYAEADWAAAAKGMPCPRIIDARNLLDPARMTQAGWRYLGLGRAPASPGDR